METKKCPTCKENKSVENFAFINKTHTRRSSWCKVCMYEYKKKHYARHRDKYLSSSTLCNHKRRAKLRIAIVDYFQSHPCVDCGENDPIVLDFDHRDPTQKKSSISRLVSRFAPLDELFEEIAKCDVRCANCHRRKTASTGNFYAYMLDAKIIPTPRRKYRRDSKSHI